MGSFLRYCFRANREAFLDDLRPKYILMSLVQDKVIDSHERQEILSQKTNKRQILQLIDILSKKGPKAFDSFIRALQEDDVYPWLAVLLEKQRARLNSVGADEQEMHQTLAKGGVPFQANHLYKRPEILFNIRDKLLMAAEKHRWWVVLHGMVGSGKSVSAAEAIRDTYTFETCFRRGVCWVPVGRVTEKPESTILHRLQILWDQLEPSNKYLSQNRQVLCMNPDIAKVKKCLTITFSYYQKREFLIVLDDVWDRSIINAFDIGCPIMVTTKDKKIMSEMSDYCSFIEFEGFSYDETNKFLSSIVKTDLSNMSEEITTIHRRTKGLPVMLSLIGSAMEPYGANRNRWKDLRSRMEVGVTKALGRHRNSSGAFIELKNVIEYSIDHLGENLKSYFLDFAIFEEDVYIPNKVLEVLWGEKKIVVEDIMYDLYQKSLISLELNKDDDSYLYLVHDLYLEYLKEECNKNNDLEVRHRKLVDNYLKLCTTTNETYNYELLPNDGYIHYYIGHHLANAGAEEYFNEMFLDFKFIQNKLRFTGSSDLLHDFSTYKQHFHEEKNDIEKFIRRNAHLLCNEEADLIQLALFEPTDSSVYKKAKELCARSDKIYYEWRNQGSAPYLSKLITKLGIEDLKCALFLPGEDVAAAAGDDSSVILWDVTTGTELEKLEGHVKPINHCCFNSSGTVLAAASADGTVTQWSLNFSHLTTKRGAKTKRNSASFCAIPGLRLGENELHNTVFSHEGEVTWCAFSPDDALIVSADSTGTTYVWTCQSKVVKCKFPPSPESEIPVKCCHFSHKMNYVATASGSSIKIWNYPDEDLKITLDHGDDIVNQFCFSKNDQFVYSVSYKSARKWNIASGTYKEFDGILYASYILCCCALSPDNNYFAAGTSNYCVIIWNTSEFHDRTHNTSSLKPVAILHGHKDVVQSINYSSAGLELLSTSADGQIIVWDMSLCTVTSMVSLENNLSVRYQNDELVIASSDYQNRIQVCVGMGGELRHKSHPDDNEITCCSLSYDCSEVIYGTKNGNVKAFLLQSGKTLKCKISHGDRVTYLLHAKNSPKFISCSEDASLMVWDRQEPLSMLLGHRGSVVMCILYSKETKLLSCSEDGTLRVWDLDTAECIMVLEGHGNQKVNYCDVSSDESMLCSASSDGTIKVWNAENGQELNTLDFDQECIRSCAFSPSGLKLVSGEDSGVVKMWRNIKCSKDVSVTVLGSHNSWVKAVKFSQDGSKFVSFSDNIKLWYSCGTLAQTIVLPGTSTCALWASEDFQIIVLVHNSVLYILQAIAGR